MTPRTWLLPGALLLLGASGFRTGQGTAPGTPARLAPEAAVAIEVEVEVEVRAFLAHVIRTLEAREPDAVRALYVADERLVWFTDGARQYSSVEEILAGMEHYGNVRFETTLSDVGVLPLAPGLAAAHSGFRTKLTIPGADDFEYGGVITWLLEKSASDSSWRVLRGHTSTPGGPPTGAEK